MSESNFITAAKFADLNTVQSLVDKVNINSKDSDGRTALWQASNAGHLDVIQFLVARKDVDVNLADKYGWSPLYTAAGNGHDAVVAVLLSHGADVNQANNLGTKPIDVANIETIQDMLITHTNKQQQQQEQPQQPPPVQAVPKMMDELQWFLAAEEGYLAVIQQGINDKIDVNCQDSKGRTAVFWAASGGHLQLVEYLITQHADLSIADRLGGSPLYTAASNGHDAVVTALLSHGADVNQAVNFGTSPLYAAAQWGRDAVVAVLLSHGADVNQANKNRDRPMDAADNLNIKDMLYAHMKKKHEESQQPVDELLWRAAAKVGDVALIQQGISDKIDVNHRDRWGYTAVCWAAREGHLKLLEYLITQHADLNIANDSRWSPLFAAAYYGHDDVVTVLLSHGADVNQADTDGDKPFDVAKNQKIKDMLIAHTNKQQPSQQLGQAQSNGQAVPKMMDESQWFEAAEDGDLALIQQGINEKMDINRRDRRGRTAVNWAAREGHVQLLEYLITQHADLNIADSYYKSPLFAAAGKGHDAVVTVLLSHGADINQADGGGSLPIHEAAGEGHDAVVTVLLSHGADVNQANKSNCQFPLHEAASKGHDAVVAVLLSHGADINQADNYGKPIEVAKNQKIKDMLYAHMKKKHEESQQQAPSNGQAVRMMYESLWFTAAMMGDLALIQQGINDKIDVNRRDSHSHTAVFLAAERGQLQLVEYLITQHADLNIANIQGDSPLCRAAIYGYDKVAAVLLSHGADANHADVNGYSPLHDAALCAHDAVVTVLLSHGADINQADRQGNSPLYTAASRGSDAVVALLLSHGADINQANRDGYKPIDVAKNQNIKDMLIAHRRVYAFIKAAEDGDLNTVQSLVDKVNINSKNSDGRTALGRAATEGRLDVVQFLLARKDVDVNLADDDGQSPLFAAAREGRDAVATVLLSNGADINRTNKSGWSPLHEAANNGRDAVVALLLSHGADINQANNDGKRPIEVAKTKPVKDMLYALMKQKYQESQQPVDESMWRAAAIMGDVALIQQGININKIDKNCRDSSGRTAVWLAAREGHVQLLEYLLTQHFADLNIVDDDGMTHLCVAAQEGHDAVVAALLIYQADINQADKNGDSPLYWAACYDRKAVVALLLSHGADVNQVDNRDESPLFMAANNGNNAVVAVLLSNGADVNHADKYGQSPLYAAAGKGHDAVVAVLLSHGADVNKANDDGYSPLYIAAKEGEDAVVAILLSHGADVNKARNRWEKPFDVAKNQKIKDKIITQERVNEFMKAAEDGDLNTVQSRVDKDNINSKNSDGRTALWQAASAGHLDVVQFLVTRKDVDVNLADKYGRSPLYIVADNKKHSVVAVLLSHGADVNQADNDGNKPIDITSDQEIKDMLIAHTKKKEDELQWFQAADKGDLAVIQQGINDKIDVNCRDSKGRTAVHWAAVYGHVQLVEYLITQHADLSIADSCGYSTLYLAAQEGHDAVVAVLLSHWADDNQADNNGHKPIDVAKNQKIKDMLIAQTNKCQWFEAAIDGDTDMIQQGMDPIIKMDVNCQDSGGRTAVLWAAHEGHLQLVEYLITQHADLSIADSYGYSPLYLAAREDHEAVVTVLLSHGANVNQADNDGQSPLYWAGMYGNNAVVAVLLSHGADVNQTDKNGRSPLYAAFSNCKDDVVTALLSHGADANQADNVGCTPLLIAAFNGHDALVAMLLSHGADVNKANNNGWSPLYTAAYNGHDAMITALLSHGAGVNQTTNNGESPLFAVARSGQDAVIASLLLSNGADVNQATNDGESPLYWACAYEKDIVVDLLLSHGADVNQANKNGTKPIDLICNQQIRDMLIAHGAWVKKKEEGELGGGVKGEDDKVLDVAAQQISDFFKAAENGDLKTIQSHVDKVNVNSKDSRGRTALWNAAWNGHLDVVQFLVTRKDVDVNLADNNGSSPLYAAAYDGHDVMVTVLLSNGADVNQANKYGESPLWAAAIYGRDAVVAVLLSHGADVNQANNTGNSPLYIAAANGSETVITVLLSHGADVNQADKDGWSPLWRTAGNGKDAVATVLLSHGADVNQADKYGQSPLWVAAVNDHDAMVTVLLSHGADVNQADKNGQSPLYRAAYNGHDAVVAVLLSHGADVNQVNKDGKKPIDVADNQEIKDMLIAQGEKVDDFIKAAGKGDLNTVQSLVDKVNINSKGSDGCTALRSAAEEGHLDVIQFLVTRKDVDVNLADINGQSPLWNAAYKGHDAVVSVLLSHGAHTNQADKNGWSPLWNAAYKGHDAMAAVLLSHGADVNQANNDGWSPLYVAASNGYDAVVAILLSHGADINKADNNGKKPIDVADNQNIKDMLIAHTNKLQQQREAEEAARLQKEADDALFLAATSNFTGLTADQVGDLVKGLGEEYKDLKPIFVKKGLHGAFIAQSMDDKDLADILKEVGVTSKLQQKTIEMKFKTFYQSNLSSTPITSPTKDLGDALSFSGGDFASPSVFTPATTLTAITTTATATTTKDSLSTAESVVSLSNVSIASFPPLTIIPWNEIQVESSRESHLGKGSYGTVLSGKWKPIQLRNVDRVVAVKVMTRGFAKEEEYLRAVQCAKAEAELIHNLCVQHGPAIGDFVMHVYGVAEGTLPPQLVSAFTNLGLPGEEGFGIVMSLAAGGTLSNLLHGGPPLRLLSMLEKLSICAQLARGLTELHAVGVIHGDMKPDNILFGDNSVTSLKIADFGTARIRGQLESTLGQSTLQRTGHIKGTPIYSAPEMMEDEDEDEDGDDGEEGKTSGVARASRSTDSYALAIIMHEILTRKKPFEDVKTFKKLSKKVLKGGRPLIDKLPADTPDTVKDMIERCWDGDREKRLSSYRCAEILARALPVFEQQKGVSRPTSAAVEPLSQTTLKRLQDGILTAVFDKLDRMEKNQEALIKGVHAHLDELSEQLSLSLNSMGVLFADLSQRAAEGDAKIDAGLTALLGALQTHQMELAKGQAHNQAHLTRLVRAATTGMEETLSDQLQNCLAEVMKGNNNAATRDASAIEKIEALVSVMTDVKEQVNSVHKLSEQQHELLQAIEKRTNLMPHTFIILPKLQPILDKDVSYFSKVKNCLLRQKDRLTGLVWESSTLFFMCPITHKFVTCGPEGKGYPINMPRAWVRALAPALKVGLILLKVALATHGLAGVVPDIPSEWLQQLNTLPGADQLVKLQSVIDQITDDGVVVDTLSMVGAIDGDAAMNALEKAVETYVDWEETEEKHTKHAFARVFQFIAEAEKYPQGVSDRDWSPKKTGLYPTSPPMGVGGRSSSLWVSRPEGIALFEKKGWNALKSKLLRAQMNVDGNDK